MRPRARHGSNPYAGCLEESDEHPELRAFFRWRPDESDVLTTTESNPEQPAVAARAIGGAVWFIAARIGAHGLRVLRLLALAYLLGDAGPTLLGVFGVALVVLMTAEALSQTGFSQALIQRAGNVDAYLPTAFTLQVGRGLMLGALIFFLAPFITAFFEKPEATDVLRFLALVPVLRGFQNIGVVFFAKELAFKKTFVLEVGSAFVDMGVTLAATFLSTSVWALAIGYVSGAAMMLVLSYVLSARRVGFGFSKVRFKELAGFSSWIFVAAVLGFALINGGDAVIGRMLPAAALGVYQMASRLSTTPAMEFARVMAAATFPAFSLLQDDPARMRNAFLKSFLVSSTVSVATAALFFVISDDLVAALLPSQWTGVAPLLPFLAVWGACRGLGATQSAVLQAAGQPRLPAFFTAGMCLLLFALIVPATQTYGALGVAGTLAVVGLAGQIGRYPFVARALAFPVHALLVRVAVPLASAIAAAWAAGAFSAAAAALPPLARAPLSVVVFGAVMLTLLAAVGRLSGLDAIAPFVEVLRTLWRKVPKRVTAEGS